MVTRSGKRAVKRVTSLAFADRTRANSQQGTKPTKGNIVKT
jgi:hypothetical protein